MASCIKSASTCNFSDDKTVATSTEQSNLADSLTKYNIQATLHPSGFYYRILNPGTSGMVANLCTQVSAYYVGCLFNGSIFDSTNLVGSPLTLGQILSNPTVFDASATPRTFVLGNVILGWQKAIPLLKQGGEMDLFIPPSLGYGNRAVGNIPANSFLIFRVRAVSFK